MPFAKAREIIAASRGTHFDPDVVDAFVADFDDFCDIADRHADSEETVAAKHASLHRTCSAPGSGNDATAST